VPARGGVDTVVHPGALAAVGSPRLATTDRGAVPLTYLGDANNRCALICGLRQLPPPREGGAAWRSKTTSSDPRSSMSTRARSAEAPLFNLRNPGRMRVIVR
jgi:hypothetical protein